MYTYTYIYIRTFKGFRRGYRTHALDVYNIYNINATGFDPLYTWTEGDAHSSYVKYYIYTYIYIFIFRPEYYDFPVKTSGRPSSARPTNAAPHARVPPHPNASSIIYFIRELYMGVMTDALFLMFSRGKYFYFYSAGVPKIWTRRVGWSARSVEYNLQNYYFRQYFFWLLKIIAHAVVLGE